MSRRRKEAEAIDRNSKLKKKLIRQLRLDSMFGMYRNYSELYAIDLIQSMYLGRNSLRIQRAKRILKFLAKNQDKRK